MNKIRINYEDILTECEKISEFDNIKLNEYIKKYNWGDFILERHCNWIIKYIKCNYNFEKLSKMEKISVDGLHSIFLRIQAQFNIYEKNNNVKFLDCILNEQELIDNILDIRNNKKEIIINPKLKKLEDNNRIINILLEMKNVRNKKQIFGDRIFVYIKELYNGKSIEDICNVYNRNKNYITTVLVGRNKPRNKSEYGIEKIYKDALLNNIVQYSTKIK